MDGGEHRPLQAEHAMAQSWPCAGEAAGSSSGEAVMGLGGHVLTEALKEVRVLPGMDKTIPSGFFLAPLASFHAERLPLVEAIPIQMLEPHHIRPHGPQHPHPTAPR